MWLAALVFGTKIKEKENDDVRIMQNSIVLQRNQDAENDDREKVFRVFASCPALLLSTVLVIRSGKKC